MKLMATAAGDSVDVILRDGGTLRLRPPERDDAPALLDFYRALSTQSLHRRFHGLPNLRPQLVESLLEPDWAERGALLGALSDEDGERIVAIGNYVRLRDPALAESAFAVADTEQGRGIGTRLLERLAARAATVGIERFVAEVLAENSSMLGVFERAGFELKRELAGGVVEVEFPIAATERFEQSVEERDHTAVVASLRSFFEPRTVAVVGASPRRGTIGGELFRNVLEADFAGAAYPVNPKGAAVAGVRGYASVAEIPDPVDLAVISVPGEHVLAAAEDALRSGVRALVVISAGFAEVGSEGAERQEQLLALVRSHGARLIGPNCLGIAVAGAETERDVRRPLGAERQHRLLLPVRRARPRPARGGRRARARPLRVRLDREQGRRLLERPARVVGGRRGDRCRPALRRVVRQPAPLRPARPPRRPPQADPGAEERTSTTGQRAASSHTAALAGSEAGVEALFDQAGVRGQARWRS